MYLTNPMEALASPERARVLAVLYRAGLPLSGHTIAALTGTVSQPTVSRLLRALVNIGLVSRVPGGYSINREHLAYAAVEALIESQRELGRRVAGAVSEWNVAPVSVVLFGSLARGEAAAGSDVDLLVVRHPDLESDDSNWASDVAALAEQVHRWTGASCEVLEYTPDDLRNLARARDPLVDALLRDGDTLVGSELKELVATVKR